MRLRKAGDPQTASPVESLEVAASRKAVADPPHWFGQIRPGRLLGKQPLAAGPRPTDKDLRLQFKPTEVPEADGDDEEEGEESKILKLFQNPLSSSSALTTFLSKVLGMSRAPGQSGGGGGEMPVGSLRRVDTIGPHARPLPVTLRLAGDTTPRLLRRVRRHPLSRVGRPQARVSARVVPGPRSHPRSRRRHLRRRHRAR